MVSCFLTAACLLGRFTLLCCLGFLQPSQLSLCRGPEGQHVSEERKFLVREWWGLRYPIITGPTRLCGLRLARALATEHDKGQAISSSSNRDGVLSGCFPTATQ